MRIFSSPLSEWPVAEPSSMTIGVLDGVHFGHRELLSHLDPELTTTVLTFEPHPVEVLQPGIHPRLITSIAERVDLFERAGVGQVGVLDLAEIKDLSPEEFVSKVLVERMAVRHLVVGLDFRFGKNRAGDAGLLRTLGERLGFEVETVGLVARGGVPVSSSRIRREIESGRLRAVEELMPVRFRITNTVVTGDRRGRAIGFPTANLAPSSRKVTPAMGVYAAFAHTSGSAHRAAVNVGVRPTFGDGDLVIEAFILDFEDDLYGKPLTIEFVDYLRPEERFPTVGDLVDQMHEDVEHANEVLEATRPSVS